MEPFLYARSKARYDINTPRWRGDDGSPLMVSALPGITRAEIDTRLRSQWRYRAALPVHMDRWISLGEGCTPLLGTEIDGIELRVKAEWANPTGSFKDRGTAVMLSMLQQQGIERMLEDSSGNGASSVAAYAAAAGIEAKILAPENTSSGKILQSRLHGAEIELVPGTRNDTAEEAIRQSASVFYASHNWHPYFLQGVKMLAYEVWEDLGFNAPRNVLVPAGAGSLVLGFSIGFTELLAAGQIDRMPRILVAQPEHCSPLAAAFQHGRATAADGHWKPTLAEGTSIARPVRDREVLAAVTASGGGFQVVTEDQIRRATIDLAARGFYVEPTSAVAAAAIPGLKRRQLLLPGDSTVMVLTGSGLKAADTMTRIFADR